MSDSQDTQESQKASASENLAIEAGALGGILSDAPNKETRLKFRDNLDGRGNAPSLSGHLVVATAVPHDYFETSETLWIVDRIIEPQTVHHFLDVIEPGMSFPDGGIIDQPIEIENLSLLFRPYSEWAPPPFQDIQDAPITTINRTIGSMDGKGLYRLRSISKELYSMKVRIWEGIMPLSARRWREKQLYKLDNFSEACRILSLVITTFQYLNYDTVQPILEELFQLIDSELHTFENAMRIAENKPLEISSLWHQFMRAKYSVMVNRAHNWITGHVEHFKKALLEEAERLASATPDSEEQAKVLDMWQDINEIAAQADYSILLPMDGYDNPATKLENPADTAETQPHRVSPSLKQRRFDYHARLAHLLADGITEETSQIRAAESPMEKQLALMRRQGAAQKLVREELRGNAVSYSREPWVANLEHTDEWGFVVYRACRSCSDTDWDEFYTKFNEDQANWGSELVGAELLRERSKLHWINNQDLGIDDKDIEALKRSFKDFTRTDNFPPGFISTAFLVVDEASVSSYLNPQTQSSSGDSGGFITIVDADFDPSRGPIRPEEAPGYTGTFRVLSSLLWDDLSALLASRCQDLETTWPLAMNHPSHLYVGPAVKVNQQAIAP